jgi:syntaxin 7
LRIQKDRLTDELIKALSSVQKCVKSAMEKQKKFDLPTSAAFYSNNSTSQHTIDPAEMARNYNNNNNNDIKNVLEQQQQVQRVKSVELQLVAERRNEIKKLEEDIVQLAEMFKDLGTLVHDQSSFIDTIENNIEETVENVMSTNIYIKEASHFNVIIIVYF